jgi:hypothetical protein
MRVADLTKDSSFGLLRVRASDPSSREGGASRIGRSRSPRALSAAFSSVVMSAGFDLGVRDRACSRGQP